MKFDGKKDSVLHVRLSSALYNWISDRSDQAGMNQSDYVRYILEDFKRAVEISQIIDGNQQTNIDN